MECSYKKIGIVGTGRIANRFVPELQTVTGIQLRGVYNPHLESAERFAKRWGITAYPELDDFLHAVDMVYIASPHETHFDYIRKALSHGKHVLCEKPMVMEKRQAEEVFGYARDEHLILMEAIKTAYCPGFRKLIETVRSGVVGHVRNVEACFTKLEKEESRELTDSLYGGSFTELGSYVMLPVLRLFGTTYEDLSFDTVNGKAGLDIFTRLSMKYLEGLATVTCGLGVKSEGRLLIAGTKGYIVVPAPWWKTSCFEIHYEDAEKIDRYTTAFLGEGLRYELQEFLMNVTGQAGEERQLKDEESIAMADIMEQFRAYRGRVS